MRCPHGQAAPARSGHKSTVAHADVAPLKESDKVTPPAPDPCSGARLQARLPPVWNVWKMDD